jgi:hypothetical protein
VPKDEQDATEDVVRERIGSTGREKKIKLILPLPSSAVCLPSLLFQYLRRHFCRVLIVLNFE